MLAARAGQLLNLSSLARDLGVAQPTAKRWLTLLERSRVVYLLRPYFRNIRKRVVKTPKLYFLDTGLLSFLLKYPDEQTLFSGPSSGSLFENYVVNEVFKTIKYRGIDAELYFFRDAVGNEIDLVVDTGDRQLLMEMKLTRTVRPRHYEQLERSGIVFSNPKRFLVSAFGESVQLTHEVRNVPPWQVHQMFD